MIESTPENVTSQATVNLEYSLNISYNTYDDTQNILHISIFCLLCYTLSDWEFE